MSDGAISQEEIDALLSGVDMGGLTGGGVSLNAPSPKDLNISALKDFASDVGSILAGSLSTMTGASFEVAAPMVETVNRDQLLRKLPEMVVAVLSDFSSGLTGDHLFVMAPEFAQKLTGLINHEESPELDDMTLSVISEIVSQHSGSEITALSKSGSLPGLACIPAEASHLPKAMVRMPQNDFVLITFPISGDAGAFTLWEVVSYDVAKGMINALVGDDNATGALSVAELQDLSDMGTGMDLGSMGGMNMAGMGMQNGMNMGAMNMNGMGMPGMGMQQQMPMGMNMGAMPMQTGMNMGMNVPNVQSLQYPNLQGGPTSMEQQNIGLIMDVFMEMTVELGRTKKQIKDILGFGEGTIIELDKLAGEAVDILVNHKPIAKGEVVVIDENFGVRITEILSPIERVSELH